MTTTNGARIGAVVSAVMLLLSVWSVWTAGRSDAATDNGSATIVGAARSHRPLDHGGSATAFNLDLGADPVCPGDSASHDFRVQSFMVPAAADLNGLTFDNSGPVDVGGEFRQPLFDTTSSPYVDELTDIAVPPAETGGVSGLPAFNFAVFAPGDVPAGDYAVGIACTLGPAGAEQLKTFWSAEIHVVTAAADQPAGITWTAAGAGGPGGNPNGEGGRPTSTTAANGAGAPTTTSVDSTTTTAVAGGGTTEESAGPFDGSNPSEPSVSSTVGDLPLAGSSPWYFVVWSACLILFGRMAILLARRPKTVPPSGD